MQGGSDRGTRHHSHGGFLTTPIRKLRSNIGHPMVREAGRMTTNWKTQKFQVGPDTVTLKGDFSLGRSRISLKAMLKVLTKEKQGLLVECKDCWWNVI